MSNFKASTKIMSNFLTSTKIMSNFKASTKIMSNFKTATQIMSNFKTATQIMSNFKTSTAIMSDFKVSTEVFLHHKMSTEIMSNSKMLTEIMSNNKMAKIGKTRLICIVITTLPPPQILHKIGEVVTFFYGRQNLLTHVHSSTRGMRKLQVDQKTNYFSYLPIRYSLPLAWSLDMNARKEFTKYCSN
jgi:hypothetical protein